MVAVDAAGAAAGIGATGTSATVGAMAGFLNVGRVHGAEGHGRAFHVSQAQRLARLVLALHAQHAGHRREGGHDGAVGHVRAQRDLEEPRVALGVVLLAVAAVEVQHVQRREHARRRAVGVQPFVRDHGIRRGAGRR